MKYIEAQNLISEYYDINEITDSITEIFIDKLLDDSNLYFIALVKDSNENAFLSDFAKTCELFDLSGEELEALAKKHTLTFNDYYIKKPFESIDDLDNFIEFLDELSGNTDDKNNTEDN